MISVFFLFFIDVSSTTYWGSHVSSASDAWDNVANAFQNLRVIKHGQIVFMHFPDFVSLHEHELLFVNDILLDFFEKQVSSLLFVSFDRLKSI